MGDFTSAVQSHQRSLAIRNKLFGEEHESTANSYRQLGVTQHNIGDFTLALQSHQRALPPLLHCLEKNTKALLTVAENYM